MRRVAKSLWDYSGEIVVGLGFILWGLSSLFPALRVVLRLDSTAFLVALLLAIFLKLMALARGLKPRFNVMVTSSPEENYALAAKIYGDVQEEVCATHLYTKPFFEGDMADRLIDGDKKSVHFRRIVTLESSEKKRWARDQLTRAKQAGSQFPLRYISTVKDMPDPDIQFTTTNFILQNDPKEKKALVSFATIFKGKNVKTSGLYSEDERIAINLRGYFDSLWKNVAKEITEEVLEEAN